MLKIKDMNLNNVIRQGDSQPRTYELVSDDNLAGKSAKIRLMTTNFTGVAYETTATVSSENKISFSIDDIIPAREYRLEITVDDYVFPSRATDGRFDIDPSSHGQEVNIIQIIGKDEIVREVKSRVENELEPLVTSLESAQQAELDRQAQEEAREATNKSAKDYLSEFPIVKSKSEEAITKANQADNLSKSVQSQFSQVVIDGDSSVEAAQARVDASGYANATLKERLDKEHTEVTTQLAQTEREVKRKRELEDLSPTVLSAIEGGEGTSFNLLSIPQDKSVTPAKTTFLEETINLFDKDNIIEGGYLSPTTGNFVENDNYVISRNIPIDYNLKYFRNSPGRISVFDASDDSLIGNFDEKIPVGLTSEHQNKSMYVILSIQKTDLDETTFVGMSKNTSNTFKPTFSPYKITNFANLQLGLESIEGVTKYENYNLFDEDSVIEGGYFSHTDGTWTPSNDYYSSGKIKITKGFTYTVNKSNISIVLFNDDTVRVGSAIDTMVTNPRGSGTYIRLRIPSSINRNEIILTEETPAGKIVPTKDYKLSLDIENSVEKITAISIDDIDYYDGDNLFNKKEIIPGGYFEPTTGDWIPDNRYVTSGKIPFTTGKKYFRNKTGQLIVFNAADDSQIRTTNATVIVMSDVHSDKTMYARLRVGISDIDFTTIVSRTFDTPDSFVSRLTSYPERTYLPTSIKNKREKRYVEEILGFNNKLKNKSRRLYLPDFSGYDQPFHPSVIYIPDGFADYKYWMVQSPYPPGANPSNQRWEVPIVYKSNDGLNWITVANPLDDLNAEEIVRNDYMSDPHILYRKDLNRLEVWYRLTHVKNPIENSTTYMFRKHTDDGENWSDRETLQTFTNTTDENFVRSPSIIWENGIYRRWKHTNVGLFYQESTDGSIWTENQELVFDVPMNCWHIDVAKYDDGNHLYHFLGYRQSGLGAVEYYHSDDGINFTRHSTVLSTEFDKDPTYANMLYRSISLKDENDNIRLYYSGYDYNNKATVGVKMAKGWDSMRNITEKEQLLVKIETNSLESEALGIEMTKATYK